VEPSLLRLDAERRGESPGQRGQQEAAAVHAGTVGRMVAKVNVRNSGRGRFTFVSHPEPVAWPAPRRSAPCTSTWLSVTPGRRSHRLPEKITPFCFAQLSGPVLCTR
jgi:hypothetical protein